MKIIDETPSELINRIGVCKDTHNGHPEICGECMTFDRMELLTGIQDLLKACENRCRQKYEHVLRVPVPMISSPLTPEEELLLNECGPDDRTHIKVMK